MPEISVIVPVYKSEDYLSRCIDSILAQTFSDFELILVDDGSPDNCGVICDEYAARDPRVRVIHKENGGVSSARNAALDIASGNYIAFADSDDTVSVQYLEELIRWREFDYVTAGFLWQDPQSNWHTMVFEESDTTVDVIRALPTKYLGKYYFGSPWATLMKRSLIERFALRFPSSVRSGEDTLFILSYLKYASTIKIVPLCGYSYHHYSVSLVHTHHSDLWKWKISVEQAFLELFSEAADTEYTFLLNREFDVLMDLIAMYDLTDSTSKLDQIYTHAFFRTCIKHKSIHGNIQEKLFIFSMEKKCYKLYKTLIRYLLVLSRVKKNITRLFVR